MINITEKTQCCGCGACQQICPKECVEMRADNEGFLYPEVDKTTCVDCHLCEKICPILNVKQEEEKLQEGYIVQNKDEEVLRQSTSGGAFTAIASWVIEQGGVVFGAAYDENLVIHHTWVDSTRELKRFRNSKYAQSEIRNSFREAKTFLDTGRIVLFSGTPCQLEGLIRFLRKSYDNLLTLDVVCRACPSPLVFKKYLEMQRDELGTHIEDVRFRDKYYGYSYSTMTIQSDGSKQYHEGIDTDPYLRAFFSEISIRPSCIDCKFRKRYRETDLTIWDCFDIAIYCKEMNNDKGATKVLAHTAKGKIVMSEIERQLHLLKIDPTQILYLNGQSEIDIVLSEHPLRQQFFEDLNSLSPKIVFDKYFPIKLKNRIEKQVRIITHKIGLYDLAKKAYVSVIGRDNIRR